MWYFISIFVLFLLACVFDFPWFESKPKVQIYAFRRKGLSNFEVCDADTYRMLRHFPAEFEVGIFEQK